jgi:hypothetical protein
MNPLTGQNIVDKFNLYKDDTSELSDAESLDLAQNIYNDVLMDREWEWLRKTFSGVTNSDGSVTLPADFISVMKNYSEDETSSIPEKAVVYVNQDVYPVIPMGARTLQGGLGNFFYIDPVNNVMKSTATLGGGIAVSFDYKMRPPALTLTTSPVFPAENHMMIVYGMAIDDDIIQIFEKARSYAAVNQMKYDKHMTALARYSNKFLIP